MSVLEPLLRRDRAVTASALVVLTVLAWVFIWRGAGMGMTALDMTVATLFPHAQVEPMPGMAPPHVPWPGVVAMWAVMMVAMMTPSAAPIILLYRRVLRHHAAGEPVSTLDARSLVLASGYLVAWVLFSVVATTIQFGLQRAGLLSPMMLWSKSSVLSAALLIGAGAYQLSPLKQTCLRHCRGPVGFLTRHYRPGLRGAFVMGLQHGAWCVGCCGLLMVLLFVGGVMNLVWIAVLAVLVLVEKLFSQGVFVSRLTGVVLILWGGASLVV